MMTIKWSTMLKFTFRVILFLFNPDIRYALVRPSKLVQKSCNKSVPGEQLFRVIPEKLTRLFGYGGVLERTC